MTGPAASAMIEVRRLSKHFGGVVAVNDVSLEIAPASITGLIGPNGAGKTTLFNVIAGNLTPTSGSILFDGEDVTGLQAHRLFHQGLLRTFQVAHEFGSLSVLENLMMVPAGQAGESLISTWLRPRRVHDQEAAILDKAREVLEFLNLSHLSNAPAASLSGGQKKLLELGRTMMAANAKAVLLDEIGAGVNRALLAEIGTAIRRLNQELGYTFCMIEHDPRFHRPDVRPGHRDGRGRGADRRHDRRHQVERGGRRGLSRQGHEARKAVSTSAGGGRRE